MKGKEPKVRTPRRWTFSCNPSGTVSSVTCLSDAAPLSVAKDMPTIPAIMFLEIGRRESYGRVERKHLFRPATDEELQQPEREPDDGILKLLKDAGYY